MVETTKWGGSVYTFNNKNVLGIGGFKSYFGLWFYNGIFLIDEKKLLINANIENTKSLRQMRFKEKNDIDETVVLSYINQAIEIEKQGLYLKKEKKETVIPKLFLDEFHADTNLKTAFEQFTPYKQREFIEYVSSAKQVNTQQQQRIEKIKPMILVNIGLNDKYRKC